MSAALLVIGLACSKPKPSWQRGSNEDAADKTVAVPEFSILIRLSERAQKELQSAHEGVLVPAMFDGDPLPGQGRYNPPNRDVYLGNDEKAADAKPVATFATTKISQSGWNRLSNSPCEQRP
jgi:hypothetical protein